MHIAIVMHDWNGGGTERVAMRLAEQWLQSGNRVTVVTGAATGPAIHWAPAGLKVVTTSPPVPRSATSRMRLGPLLAEEIGHLRPDVVYLPGNFHFVLARWLDRVTPRPAIVGTISNPMLAPHVPFKRVVMRHALQGIDHLVAISEGLADQSAALHPAIPCIRIDNPITLPDVAVGEGPTDRWRLVAIGRLVHQKNFELALQTLALLRRDGPYVLDIVGEGPDRRSLEHAARKLGVADAVSFIGHVPDVSAHLRAAAALLVTSRYEGGPLVAIEAIACGTPVVSTNCGTFIADLLTDRRLGVLVDRHDAHALAEAVRQQARKDRPCAVARSVLHRFNPPDVAERYRQLFEQVRLLRPGQELAVGAGVPIRQLQPAQSPGSTP